MELPALLGNFDRQTKPTNQRTDIRAHKEVKRTIKTRSGVLNGSVILAQVVFLPDEGRLRHLW